MTKDELVEEARKYAEQSISLAVSMTNPKAETIARYAYMAGYDSAFKELCKNKKKALRRFRNGR